MKSNKNIYSVSELNKTVQQSLMSQFPLLWLEGEISNFSKPASGHIYLQLKDSKAQLRAAMFAGKNRLLRFKPQNGMQVLVRGRIGLYEPRGDYQFIIEHMEEAGHGEMQRAYEALKDKLQQEGLFSEDQKQSIPSLPKQIGIVSSPTGAALQDALHVIKTRYPQCPVVIYPCMVQGEQADKTIIHAIQQANLRKECDVLLMIRGGGSIEDLNAFNSEALARVIFDSNIPIISGVGHEIDFTIGDFVADSRAPTPSAAAEYATPESQTLKNRLQLAQQQLINEVHYLVEQQQNQISLLYKQLQAYSPLQQLRNKAQRLDDMEQHLQQVMQLHLAKVQQSFQQQESQLKLSSPLHLVQTLRSRFNEQQSLLTKAQQKNTEKAKTRCTHLLSLLHTVSPLATLDRGYAIAISPTGEAIQSSEKVAIGDPISIRLAKGSLHAEVKAKN